VVKRPSGPITDPEEIHDHRNSKWQKKFSHPEDSLPYYLGLEAPPQPGNPLPSAEIWEGFLTDPESMVKRYHEDERLRSRRP
jgi:hypothetical protein